MVKHDFDMISIGAGSGGMAASRRAGSYGAKVAICEESRVGGTCVIRGCVPKKLLVYASHFAHDMEDAEGFGWTIPERRMDWARLIAAKDKEIDRLNGIYIRMLHEAGVTLLEGRARLVDRHSVEIGGRVYTAKHVLVATGSHPVRPSIRGIEHAITSNEALSLPSLPERIAIVGGGYIAVELAGIWSALGVKVTMIIRGETVLRGFDGDVRSTLTAELSKKGIELRCGTSVEEIEREGDALRLRTRAGEELSVGAVMFATGRKPNTRGMGLEEAGVKLDGEGAVIVDERSCSVSRPSVYAVGDCTNRINLTPVAIAEGRAVAETLFNNRPTIMSHINVPSAVFSQPPVATVGLSEEQARARPSGSETDVYVASFKALKHTLSGRDERTMMKLVVDRATGRVLGCHMVGADAPEIIQGVAIAIRCGATKEQFDTTIGIHPSAAEELVTMRTKRADPIAKPEA